MAARTAVRTTFRAFAITAATAVGLTGALAAGPAQATDPTTPVTPELRVMQLNIRHGLSPSSWAADAQRATTMADITTFQEASESSDRAALAAMLQAQGWGYWWPSKGGVENPIAWNGSLYSLVSTRSIETHGGQSGVTPARFINRVVLRQNATDRLVAVISTHTINKGAPDGGQKQNSRTARLKKHLGMLKSEFLAAEQITPFVIADGDLNVNYMRDRNIRAPGLPTDVLGPYVNFDMPIGPTWGGTTELDYVMTPKRTDAFTRVSGALVSGFRTDHKGVQVSYTFAGDTPTAPTTPTTPPTTTPPPPSGARFTAGRVVNRPHGSLKSKRKVLALLRKAVDNAPQGSAIHLSTSNLDDSAMRYALLRAERRGVYVQLVVRNHGLNSLERQLRSALHRNTQARTWFATCSSSHCKKVARKMPTTTLLVSQAGQTPALRITSNRALDRSAKKRSNTARVSTSLRSYNTSFHDFFALIG